MTPSAMPTPKKDASEPTRTRAHGSSVRRRAFALAMVTLAGVGVVAGVLALSRGGAQLSERTRAAGSGGRESTVAALRVSRDFGAAMLLNRAVPTSATSTALNLLAGVTRVDTAYGGGFVNAINGLASGFTNGGSERADWFFWVNGLQGDRSAADIRIAGGDAEWWDYHRWDFAPSVPAVVGQFPQPFAAGAHHTLPTQVLYVRGCEDTAREVLEALRAAGAKRVSIAPLSVPADLPRAHHVVLIGPWEALAAVPAVTAATRAPSASGLFARIERDRLVTLDSLGTRKVHAQNAGIVMATASPEEPAAAIWLVTGGSNADIARASALLANGAPQLMGRFGVAVLASGATIALPTEPTR